VNYLFGLALNHDLPDLCLLSSQDYRRALAKYFYILICWILRKRSGDISFIMVDLSFKIHSFIFGNFAILFPFPLILHFFFLELICVCLAWSIYTQVEGKHLFKEVLSQCPKDNSSAFTVSLM
jgi:hypothetical protein